MHFQKINFLEFNGKKYPYTTINVNEEPLNYYLVISVQDLEKELLDENGSPVNKEAEALDNSIAFYMDKYEDLLKSPTKILDLIYS